jgi:hypothetical protein
MRKETTVSDTDGPGDGPLPPDLRFLKGLVTVLTAVMIGGVIAVVALLVIRLPGAAITVPAALALPEGAEARAVTQMPGAWLVVTEDGRLLLFGQDGAFRRAVPLQ